MEEASFNATLTGLFSVRRFEGCRIKHRYFHYLKVIMYTQGLHTAWKYPVWGDHWEILSERKFLTGVKTFKMNLRSFILVKLLLRHVLLMILETRPSATQAKMPFQNILKTGTVKSSR